MRCFHSRRHVRGASGIPFSQEAPTAVNGSVEGEITVGFVFRESAVVESSVQTDAEILVEVEAGCCVFPDHGDASGENRVFRNAGESGVERVTSVFQRNRRAEFSDFSRRELDGDFCQENIFSRGVVHCGNGHGGFNRFCREVCGFRGDRNGCGGFGDNKVIRSGYCNLNAVVRSGFCFEELKGIEREIRNGVLLLILSGQEQMREPVGAAGRVEFEFEVLPLGSKRKIFCIPVPVELSVPEGNAGDVDPEWLTCNAAFCFEAERVIRIRFQRKLFEIEFEAFGEGRADEQEFRALFPRRFERSVDELRIRIRTQNGAAGVTVGSEFQFPVENEILRGKRERGEREKCEEFFHVRIRSSCSRLPRHTV